MVFYYGNNTEKLHLKDVTCRFFFWFFFGQQLARNHGKRQNIETEIVTNSFFKKSVRRCIAKS